MYLPADVTFGRASRQSFFAEAGFGKNVDDLIRIVDAHQRRAGLAVRLPVRLAALAVGSDLVSGGFDQPVAGGRLAAIESVQGMRRDQVRPPSARGRTFPCHTRRVSLRLRRV